MTSDLPRRIWEHRSGIKSKFPAKYAIYRLVYVETLDDMDSAISREKQLKRGHRQWKINLIEADNPHWIDLAVGLGFEPLRDRPEPLPKPSPELVSGSRVELSVRLRIRA